MRARRKDRDDLNREERQHREQRTRRDAAAQRDVDVVCHKAQRRRREEHVPGEDEVPAVRTGVWEPQDVLEIVRVVAVLNRSEAVRRRAGEAGAEEGRHPQHVADGDGLKQAHNDVGGAYARRLGQRSVHICRQPSAPVGPQLERVRQHRGQDDGSGHAVLPQLVERHEELGVGPVGRHAVTDVVQPMAQQIRRVLHVIRQRVVQVEGEVAADHGLDVANHEHAESDSQLVARRDEGQIANQAVVDFFPAGGLRRAVREGRDAADGGGADQHQPNLKGHSNSSVLLGGWWVRPRARSGRCEPEQ
mmetsp:Transcript_23758/g.73619  ORF Transcript_23758/g.73619 Transcript_23758/m.73619 type:complete len:304 (-) Transcript_23758:17-928(-)